MPAAPALPGWPELLSIREAAAYCGMSPDSFALCVARGRFPPAVDLPIRRRLWQRSALDAAISKGSRPADDAAARKAAWQKRREDRAPDAGQRHG
jgi:predicted DNA-binding transcriptional regulator AlpA